MYSSHQLFFVINEELTNITKILISAFSEKVESFLILHSDYFFRQHRMQISRFLHTHRK